jgi:hypothetical protein
MGKIEIKKIKSGFCKFDLKASNGQVILSSQSNKSMSGCKKGISSVQKNAKEDIRYNRKTAKDGSPYFTLKANNGQIIGTSEMYSNTAEMENGIASIKKNAIGAPIENKS